MDGGLSLVELSQDFLLTWNYCYTAVEKEMALMKGKSFGKHIYWYVVLTNQHRTGIQVSVRHYCTS